MGKRVSSEDRTGSLPLPEMGCSGSEGCDGEAHDFFFKQPRNAETGNGCKSLTDLYPYDFPKLARGVEFPRVCKDDLWTQSGEGL